MNMTEEEKEYILDNLRQMFDSGNQAQAEMNKYFLDEIKGLRQEINFSLEKQLLHVDKAVAGAVETQINGKLRDIKHQLNNQDQTIKPLVDAFQTKKIVRMALTEDGKTIFMYASWVVMAGAAWVLFKGFIISLFK